MKNKVHAVGIIFENKEGKILVLRRNKQDPEGETLGLVGGKIESGENRLVAAKREVKEEIGYNPEFSQLQFLKTYHWDRNDLNIIFEVFKLRVSENPIINLQKSENTEYFWLPPDILYRRGDLMIGLYPILEDVYGIKRF